MQMQAGKKEALSTMQIWQRTSTELKTASVKAGKKQTEFASSIKQKCDCNTRLAVECKSMDVSPFYHLTVKERIRRRRKKEYKKINALQRYLLTTAVDDQFSGRVAAVDVQAGMLHIQSAAVGCINPGRVCDGFIGSDSDVLCVKLSRYTECQQMSQVATNTEAQSLSQQFATW